MEDFETPVEKAQETSEPTYAEAFPPLCNGASNGLGECAPSQWTRQPTVQGGPAMALKSSMVTQVFIIPKEERRFQNEDVFGDHKMQNSIVSEIMNKHDVVIEMSVSKDQSLSVIVLGKAESVMRARKDFTQQLQQQGNLKMHIPKEHHRYIIGTKNKIREQLEMETGTRIRLPRPDDASDVIEVIGTKEGIERARTAIQVKSDELSKLAVVRLSIPKIYHPFISGPNGSLIKELIEKCGGEVRVHIPPHHINADEISISGEKEGVQLMERSIRAIYENKVLTCMPVSVEVEKPQHKYITGTRNCNLAEILAETGVWVEVPPSDSPSCTVTLRGDEDKLGQALTMVCSKAHSMMCINMSVESWLHRFIIGAKGASIRQINQQFPKVHIELKDSENTISLEGPNEDVANAKAAIEEKVKDLMANMAYVKLDINQKFHKNIIGKNGANISRIRKDTGVVLRVPSDESNSSIIRVEGSPEGVHKVKQELLEMVSKLENEKSKDILIDYNLHKLLIGTQGARIREIREKFNQVQISFPGASQQSDVVQLRGQKADVDHCYKYMQQLVAEVTANNFKAEVHVFKDFHRNIIGKGGSMIKKIREETDAKVELPKENSLSDVIVITGKKENVEKAKKMIQKIQTEMANVKDETIEIAQKLHQGLIGAKGKLIKSISDECGGVQIRFPSENVKSDKVHLNGPKEDVDKAVELLKKLASEKAEMSHTAEVRTQSINHGFLIGPGGASINKLKEQLGVRFSFASPKDPDPDLITIIGRKDAVEKAKVQLEARITDLKNVIELPMEVDPKHHRHFIARRAEVVNRVSDECGGISISFPKAGTKSSVVVLKGAKECVEAAKVLIEKEVADLESQVTIEVVIPQKHHGNIMGAKGCKIQEITRQFNVNIKLPERAKLSNGGPETEATDGNCVTGDERPPPCDVIVVSGLPDNCEAAKQAMLDLVPVTEQVEIQHDFHGQIIGQQGAFIRKIQTDFGVNLMVPPQCDKNDWIRISGPAASLPAAKEELFKKVKAIVEERKDRELRNFTLEVVIPHRHHFMLIGKKGASINAIRDQFNVNIKFPERATSNANFGNRAPSTAAEGEEEEEEEEDVEKAEEEINPADVIVIKGYEKNANEAKEAMLAKVEELESLFTLELNIDNRTHRKLIGHKRKSVNELMETFKVDIKFPRDSPNPDLVIISGAEDDVYNCRDELFALEDQYLQDLEDQEEYRAASKPTMQHFMPNFQNNNDSGKQQQAQNPKGFVVRDAPWCQPPLQDNITEFPSLANLQPSGNAAFSSAWGPPKKI